MISRNSYRRHSSRAIWLGSLGIAATAVLLFTSGAGATRYYVKNDGSDTASGLSWTAAWATVGRSLSVMMPGDSVMVANGNYIERLETVRSGTASAPITLVASGDSVFLSWADDLDDAAFTRTSGYSHIWQLNGWTQGDIRQARFNPILVNDPNWSRYTMLDTDGPITLTNAGISSLARLDQIEGTFWVNGGTLYVHPQGNVTPSRTATDLWSNRGDPALVIQHDYIVLDGFRIWFADGSSGGLNLLPATDGCQIRNFRMASAAPIVNGHDHLIYNLRSTHCNTRGASGLWYEDAGGAGIIVLGSRVTIQGGEIFHNWNNISSHGDTLTVDGTRIHGSPNHAWLPTDTRRLKMRNVIEYNCQDGLYLSSCEDVLIENCTCFDGVFAQITPGGSSGIGIGPITVRNSILMGGMTFLKGTPPSAESRVTFENNLFFTPGNGLIFRHILDSVDYDLAGYLLHALTHPLEAHATMIGNLQLSAGLSSVIMGGAWVPETDYWDIHITGLASLARNTGSSAAHAPWDFENDTRPAGGFYDIGADEYRETATGVGESGPAAPGHPASAIPNPFSRSTTIRCSIETAAAVTVRIYDAEGRLVRTLANSVMVAPGESGFSWNGTGDDGRTAPAGIYYYRAQAGPMVETGRLVLLR